MGLSGCPGIVWLLWPILKSEMGVGRWAVGDVRWEMGVGHGRLEIGDGDGRLGKDVFFVAVACLPRLGVSPPPVF